MTPPFVALEEVPVLCPGSKAVLINRPVTQHQVVHLIVPPLVDRP
jgi:hypothetical protein